MTRWSGVTVLLLGIASGTAQAEPAATRTIEQVSECMRANVPHTLQIKDVTMTSTDKLGAERIMSGRLYAIREEALVRVMWRLEAPADLRGAAYLVREARVSGQDEMYVYLPALNKTRRITGGSQDNPLFGSDISYSDVKQINHAFNDGSATLEPSVNLDGRPAYVIAMKPGVEEQSRYELIRSWVDQKTCVALKAEFVEAGIVRKRFTASPKNLKQSGALWYLSEALIEDLNNKTRTRLSVTGLSSGKDVADRYFNARTFFIGG